MASRQVRAIVGARVSHVQGKQKVSHLEQHDTGGKYSVGQGWDIVGSFEDLDISAIKTSPWERPDLKPWLADRAHEWDAMIVTKTDRLFRSAKDSVDLCHWAEQNKKILVMVEDGLKLDFFHPEDEQDPWALMMTKVFLLLAAVFAELEGRRFLQRAQSRTRYLRSTDRWPGGVPTFGFVVVDHPSGAGKALDHESSMQAVLHSIPERWIFPSDVDESLVGITSSLIAEGALSPRDHRRMLRGEKPKGEHWSVDTVRTILTSPATQGIKIVGGKPALRPDGSVIRVGPPSFTPEEWSVIQAWVAERTESPRERRHTDNPMVGVGRCKCGKGLRQRTLDSGNRYYACARTPRACPGVSMLADDADERLAQTFLDKCGGMVVLRRVFDPGEDTSYELEEVDQTIASLREDRSLGLFPTPVDEAVYRDQMKALVGRRAELGSKEIRPAQWVYESTDRTYRQEWNEADPPGRRKLLRDAGVKFTLISPTEGHVHIDLEVLERMEQGSRR